MRAYKPNRREYEAIRWTSPNPDNWLVKKRHNDFLILSHRFTGYERKIPV